MSESPSKLVWETPSISLTAPSAYRALQKSLTPLEQSSRAQNQKTATLHLNLLATLDTFASQNPGADTTAWYAHIKHENHLFEIRGEDLDRWRYGARKPVIYSLGNPERNYALEIMYQYVDIPDWTPDEFPWRHLTIVPLHDYLRRAVPEFMVGDFRALNKAREEIVTDVRLRNEAMEGFEGACSVDVLRGGTKL
ncbi:MAG: hypothetical protein Q9168_005519 [Polycauliona sp. 1 TL-2023]